MILQGSAVKIGEIPDFGFGRVIFEERNTDCQIIRLENVTLGDFKGYVQMLEASLYGKVAENLLGETIFCTYRRGETALYLGYSHQIEQMLLVGEYRSAYLKYVDEDGVARLNCKETVDREPVDSLLTQIDLEEFGFSCVIRLNDGSFLIIDGGWDFEQEADKLMEALVTQSRDDKPRIAAWIITHPHCDHYRCFITFYQKYGQDVKIESVLYHFPELTDESVLLYPGLGRAQELEYSRRFEQVVAASGVDVIRPHTGQIYEVSNARLEVIASPDDVWKYPCDVNNLSIVIKMTIENQSILFCSDCQMETMKLARKYGSYLKSDILQITHHGFNGGSIACYKLIDPKVCLIPANENLFCRYMGYFSESNRFLLYDLNVQDVLIGGRQVIDMYEPKRQHTNWRKNIVVELPYTPRLNGRQLMFDRIRELQAEQGAKSWVFADMTWEECKFSFLNPSFMKGTVYASLYFEERAELIRDIKITVPGYTVTKIDFENPEDIEADAFVRNTASLTKMGIPEGKRFTLHFLCETPMVIWGEKQPVYVH